MGCGVVSNGKGAGTSAWAHHTVGDPSHEQGGGAGGSLGPRPSSSSSRSRGRAPSGPALSEGRGSGGSGTNTRGPFFESMASFTHFSLTLVRASSLDWIPPSFIVQNSFPKMVQRCQGRKSLAGLGAQSALQTQPSDLFPALGQVSVPFHLGTTLLNGIRNA